MRAARTDRSRLAARQRKEECRAPTRLRFRPNTAPKSFHNAAGNGEPQPGAGVLLGAMEPLKQNEDALGKTLIEADALVANREPPGSVQLVRGHMDPSRLAGFSEFDGVVDDAAENRGQPRGVAGDHRQRI